MKINFIFICILYILISNEALCVHSETNHNHHMHKHKKVGSFIQMEEKSESHIRQKAQMDLLHQSKNAINHPQNHTLSHHKNQKKFGLFVETEEHTQNHKKHANEQLKKKHSHNKASFVQMDEQANADSNMKTQLDEELEDGDMLYSTSMTQMEQQLNMIATLTHLSKAKKKFRFTKDGRKCAEVTTLNGNQFEGCTTSPTPDGKADEEEWCDVDPSESGSPRWGYCDIQFNFDQLRRKVFDLQSAEIPEIQKIKEAQQVLTTAGVNMVKEFKELEDKQMDCVSNLEKLKQQVNHLKEMQTFLGKLKSQWEEIGKKTQGVLKEIEDANKVAARTSFLQTSDSVSLMTTSKLTVQQHLGLEPKKDECLDKPAEGAENCDGMLGYETDPQGDGLIAYYFDNEMFMGEPVQENIDTLDFDWHGEPPADDTNPDNFSARYVGFLRAPVTGNYVFRVKVDDGARFFLNGELLIAHNFADEPGCHGHKSIFDVNGPMQGINRDQISASNGIELVVNMKYEIMLEVYHSVHMKHYENQDSFVSLSWESEKIREEVIPKQYLYRSDKSAPLKPTGFDEDEAELDLFQDGDTAFKDTDLFIIEDIPIKLQGLTMLKVEEKFTDDYFEFDVNADAIVYVAIVKTDLSFIQQMEQTKMQLTVIKIAKDANKGEDCKIKAHGALEFVIFMRKFKKGEVKIPFIYPGKKKDTQIIIFFKLDDTTPDANEQVSCGGSEVLASDPDGDEFAGCKASSQIDGFECEAGLSNKMTDAPGSIWVTDGQGIGASLAVKFNSKIMINKIEYLNREDPGMRNRELVFDMGGTKKTVELRNVAEVETFTIDPPVIADGVTMTITGVYQSCKNGGAMNVYGIKCKTQEYGAKIDDKGKVTAKKVADASCKPPMRLANGKKAPSDLPQEGELIEMFDDTTKTWKAALVTVLKENDVTAEFREIKGKTRTIKWPDPDIMKHVEEPKQKQDFNFKVCFTAKEDCPDGYEVDNGKVFEANGKYNYGWSRDMSQMTRFRQANPDPLLANNILFPPAQESQWCVKSNPLVSCEPAEWSIKVPTGNYEVSLTAGDAETSAEYGIKINGKPIMTNMVLDSNQFFTGKEKVIATDGKITVSAFCEEHCDNVWSRMSALVIEPFKTDDSDEEGPTETTKLENLGCGNAFKGGRCDQDDSKNVENCVYENRDSKGLKACDNGLWIIEIPKSYMCPDQREKFKCVRQQYDKKSDCELSCPGRCDGKQCNQTLRKKKKKL